MGAQFDFIEAETAARFFAIALAMCAIAVWIIYP